MMNETEIAGPVRLPAVDAVIVKMPAPITTDTPKTVRSHQVRSLRSRLSGSSVSCIDCSTDFVRNGFPMSSPLPRQCTQVLCSPMGRLSEHAVVIGASIAGLCAARVLSDFYDHVTLFDRDTLPDTPASRAAVPQGRHVHILMARGAHEFGAAGHLRGMPTELRETFTTSVPSRPHREWQSRRRTSALANVQIRQCAV